MMLAPVFYCHFFIFRAHRDRSDWLRSLLFVKGAFLLRRLLCGGGGDPFILRGGVLIRSLHLAGGPESLSGAVFGDFCGTLSCNFCDSCEGVQIEKRIGCVQFVMPPPARPRGWPRPSPVLRMGGGGGLYGLATLSKGGVRPQHISMPG